MPDPVRTSTAEVWLDDEGICHLVYLDGARDTLETAREVLESMRVLTGGVPVPTLIDIRKVASTSREARAFYGSEAISAVATRGAMLVASGLSRALGNFFLGVTSPATPVRLFTSEAEALEWLKGRVP